ncbi:MAG: Trm112 family protein [Actinomycetia bacterium]|nr:Trm112 family protein [Actinomycetes bacterium]MCH9701907.1 Trm112 family protein [Actinomycetes bacterium]MCH9761122.1 Trm112 family protein [Actinomycetes bacterium]
MALDPALLAILVCPEDRGRLLLVEDHLYNPRLRRKYRIDEGIPVLLVDEAVTVDDDEHLRLLAADQSCDRVDGRRGV